MEGSREEKKPLLTREQVAGKLRISMSTLSRFIDQGKFPVVKVGGQVRVRPEDLEKFLETGATIKAEDIPHKEE